MASIHKDILIDASPNDVWDAVRDFGALHTRLVPGFVTDTKLDGEARIVTFANGTVARELLVDCDEARRRRDLRAREAAQRFGAGFFRWRCAEPAGLDRRRAAERDRALYRRADGSGGARDAERPGPERRMMISAFLDALGADGPAADRAGKMDLYGRFVGSWDLRTAPAAPRAPGRASIPSASGSRSGRTTRRAQPSSMPPARRSFAPSRRASTGTSRRRR